MIFLYFILFCTFLDSYRKYGSCAGNDYSKHPCKRKCVSGLPPMVCNYDFEIENYNTLSKACYDCPFNVTDCFLEDCVAGEGSRRGIITVNRKLPGPAIEVCQHDTIVVDVHNKMLSESTIMHWHGIHQKKSPYMDGAPFLTQCPFLPRGSFRYTFPADNVGTHFYHSHIGMQRVDGMFGAIIVRATEENNPHSDLYDFDLSEHVMVVTDWTPEMGLQKFLGHMHDSGTNKAPSIIVNGLGRYVEFKDDDGKPVYVPTARFHVEQGYRYRFRVINAGFLNCPIEMSIDGHNISIISGDGHDIKATPVTSFDIFAGERFDFILHANQSVDLYWMKFKGSLDCGATTTRAFQTAVLQYHSDQFTDFDYPAGEVDFDNAGPKGGIELDTVNVGTETKNKNIIVLPELESVDDWDESLKEKPDYQFYISYDFYKVSHSDYYRIPYYGFDNITNPKEKILTPQFNHISMEVPSKALLSQRDEIDESTFCNNDTMADKNCKEDFCYCPHVIKVPVGAVVELVFIDEGLAYNANHPIHLHGYAFRVVAMERLGNSTTIDEVRARDEKGLIKRNLKNAPLKDTVSVPDGGYVIGRLKADNPGYWFLHCHLEVHAEIGMAMVFQVGEKDDMLPVPEGFPKCGDYEPKKQ
ncbi:unnamed protein product [Phyllotreta striolata]|uniref:Uncharacterized protein n=1 Tax=Phyllotreta striolata TaxID=444603 RepID=A0A9N9TS51_PHYSR|nr:unnamed protein product [Phyllotreta striolata]